MNKFDMSWGNAPAVREAFLSTLSYPLGLKQKLPMELDYPPHEGMPELIEITKKVVKRQTGLDYKHVLLTNGATGGVTISLRFFRTIQKKYVITRPGPYFPIYPAMIESAGLKHIIFEDNESLDVANGVALIDIPSNPHGNFFNKKLSIPVICDSVYGNKVYCEKNIKFPDHQIMVGSYSKLLGLNGIRIGWIATNLFPVYAELKRLVTAEYCGIDVNSQVALIDLLKSLDDNGWDFFETTARYNLDSNRTEWSKLEKYFNSVVSPNGMFYYSSMDKKCKKLMEKAGIIWTLGSSTGTDDSFGRFNLGQDCKLVKEAVKTVIKLDRIK